jgi:hypothetical protein
MASFSRTGQKERQTLYCQQFFMDEFGKKSNDMFLTDCFGFTYALPTICAHCGLKGFSTSKLWAGADFMPFSNREYGRWIGPDGGSIVAATNCGNYYQSGLDVRTADGDAMRAATQSFANGPGAKPGFWATYDFVNDGDPQPRFLPVLVRVAGMRNALATFNLPAGEIVRSVSVFDAKGRLIKNLAGNGGPAGTRTILWDRTNMESQKIPVGMYYLNCKTDHSRYSALVHVL